MPHVSKKELDSKTKKRITETFELVLGKMDKSETNSFFFSLLSETERLMLAKRLSIAILLHEGMNQSSISEVLCVTRETVSRIELSMLKSPKGYDVSFAKIRDDETINGFKNTLVGLARYSVKAAGGRVDL